MFCMFLAQIRIVLVAAKNKKNLLHVQRFQEFLGHPSQTSFFRDLSGQSLGEVGDKS